MNNLKKYCLFLIPLMVLSSCVKHSDLSDDQSPLSRYKKSASFFEKNNTFGLNLFMKMAPTEKANHNLVISPLNTTMILGMALNGMQPGLQSEVLDVVGWNDITTYELNDYNKTLIHYLQNQYEDVELQILNSIWYNESMDVDAGFLERNERYYYSESKLMDKDKQVSNQINHWIRSHSGGHIKVVIPQIENGNLLYLVNATFFKGDWQSEFNSGKTATSFFYSENGKAIPSVMMWQKADLNYFENARFQMVNLPYKNPNFSMYVLLPKEGYTINSLMKDLDYQKLRDYKEAMQLKRNINFGMPKFRCEYTMNLKQLMKQTGLDHLFVEEQVEDLGSGVARFGTMVQKTVIDVDEKGTQASVVSSVAASFTNLVDDNPFNLIINHPFIFMIEEKQSNSLLFIGKITKP